MSLSVASADSRIPQQRFDVIANLPPVDMLRLICSFLDSPKDVVHFGLASKRLNVLLSDTAVWNLFVHKHFPDSYTKLKSETESLGLYQHLTTMTHNIETGKYHLRLVYADQVGVTCMKIWGDKLIFGVENHTIRILDLSSRQKLQTLKGHQGKITCTAIWGDKLFSGSEDSTIKIWNLNTGQKPQTVELPSRVSCMAIWEDKFIYSLYNEIKIWNLNTGQKLQPLKGHLNRINCLTILGNKLFSGSNDCTIKIWDLNTKQCLQTLEGHQAGIECMTIWNDKLFSGSDDRRIKMWDINTGRALQELQGHKGGVSHMAILGDKLFSGSNDRTIKIWDPHTGQTLKTLQEYPSYMTVWNDNALITSLYGEAFIKIWNFNPSSPGQQGNFFHIGLPYPSSKSSFYI